MPIKFRCQHCRQFLGISRGKAGAVVDCPTCGRTLRVPHLDGRVDPLPEPGMDPRDSRLSQALDELARIGGADDESQEFEQRETRRRAAAVVTRDEDAPFALAPLPEPVAVEPPPAIDPLPVAGGLKVKPLPERKSTTKDVKPASDSGNAILNRARQSSAFSDDLFELAQEAPTREAEERPPAEAETYEQRQSRFATRRRPSPRVVALLALSGVAAAGVAIGFLAGRASAPSGTPPQNAAAAAPDGQDEGDGASATPQALRGLAGRISYASDRQTLRPDDGARIIAVPGGAAAAELLSAEMLLDDVRREVAASEIVAAHGGFAAAADDGTFELSLPAAGVYRILVVSRRQSRDAQAPLDPSVEAFVREWLDRPGLVTDARACRVREIRYSGEGRVPFDCVFE
jgi:hypothetical protein